MSRPAAAMNPGQTNRRFMLLALVLGLIGAVLVYVAFSRESGTGGGVSGDQVPVVVAKTDIAARTRITAGMVEVKLVGAADRSAIGFADTLEVVGQTTRFPIVANEQVLATRIVTLSGTGSVASKSLAFVVPPGKRAMAVTVSEVVAVGGLVLAGDYVDIVAVYDMEFQDDPRDPTSRSKVDAYFIHYVLQNIEVLAVSQGIVDLVPQAIGTPGPNSPYSTNPETGQRVRNTEGKPNPEAITVTLALTQEEAQKLYLAESNGKIRMMIRAWGDQDVNPITHSVETDLFPRNLPNPFIR